MPFSVAAFSPKALPGCWGTLSARSSMDSGTHAFSSLLHSQALPEVWLMGLLGEAVRQQWVRGISVESCVQLVC